MGAAIRQTDRSSLMWLLVASTWAVAPLALHVPWWLTATLATLLVWAYLHAARGWPLPGAVLRVAVALLLVALIYRHYQTLFSRDPGVSLLMVLSGLKLLEARGYRDYVISVVVLFVLMAGALLFEQSIGLGMYTLGSVMLVIAALASLQNPASARVGAHLRLAFGLVAKAVPIMVLSFLLFPRIHGGLWSVGAFGQANTGMSDTMRPGSVSRVSESDTVAFRVEFETDMPAQEQRYWRTLVLNHSDGREWTRGSAPADAAWQPASEAVVYTVIAEPSGRHWLSALDRPGSVPDSARPISGYLLESRRPVDTRLRYRVVSYPGYQTSALSSEARAVALQLPPVSSRVQELADEVLRKAASPADAVTKVLAYFHTRGFAYSLQPPALGADPVDEFLFETRTGFCEHYAGAFVTLMRAMGVPARVVLGYQGGELHPSGGYLIVREADAHAWAEVWIAPQGWVRIDPTAAVAPERIQYGSDAVRRLMARGFVPGRLDASALARAMELPWFSQARRKLRFWWDGIEMGWERWVAGYTPERQQDLLKRLGMDKWSWNIIVLALAGLIGLLLTALAYSLRPRVPIDPVQRIYRDYCRKLAQIGLKRTADEGPLAFARRCAAARPELEAVISAISHRYIALRYGEGAGQKEIDDLRERVGAFRPVVMKEVRGLFPDTECPSRNEPFEIKGKSLDQ